MADLLDLPSFALNPETQRPWNLDEDLGRLQWLGSGGGVVEGCPHDMGKYPEGKKMSSSFLYNGTRRMYEEAGFTFDRSKGLKNCVMTLTVPPA